MKDDASGVRWLGDGRWALMKVGDQGDVGTGHCERVTQRCAELASVLGPMDIAVTVVEVLSPTSPPPVTIPLPEGDALTVILYSVPRGTHHLK
jgi:hypothetical protein